MEKPLGEKEQHTTADIVSAPHDVANVSRDRAKNEGVLRSADRTCEADQGLIRKITPSQSSSWFSRGAKSGSGLPKGIYWGVAGLIALFIASFVYVFYVATVNQVSRSLENDVSRFRAGVESLKNLDFDSAEEFFSTPSGGTNFTFQGLLEKIQPLFQTVEDIAGSFQKLSASSAGIAREISFFQNDLFDAFLEGRGEDIMSHLISTEEVLGTIIREADMLVAHSESFDENASEAARTTYFPLKLDMVKLQGFLHALIAWFEGDASRPAPHGDAVRPITDGRHVLVMFQNPSEIRPAGGFLGSYADAVIARGALGAIDVRDINDSDRGLKQNIIPPKPLQAAVTRLRAADANWLFDFSESAKLVTQLMEASELYATSSVRFDAAIAISPKVIQDILALVGPLELTTAKFTFTAENFFEEIQRRVQVGQAQRATYPKEVLKELSAAMLARARLLEKEKKGEFTRFALEWFEKKDIMLYFKDAELQRFFKDLGATGTPYAPPANFEGDYLAVVDANVGGGKSDTHVRQDVLLQSQIGADGTVTNHLVVKREHRGNKATYSWQKLPNEDYLQIFVPRGARLVNVRGGTTKTVVPAANYAKNNYVNDPTVGALNSSTVKVFNFPSVLRHEESGREVWATWVKIKAGEKTEVVFDYTHRLFLEPRDGSVYQFVFEKQAGTKRHYKLEIAAPVGYHFLENDSPVYEYATDDPPGRLILDLTLKKI